MQNLNEILQKLKNWFSRLTRNQKIILAVAVILVIGNMNSKFVTSTNNVVEEEVKIKGKADKWDAYSICTQIARKKYGPADFNFDEAWDYGNGLWHVRGYADIPQKRITWTGEVKHNPDDDTWDLKGWADDF